MARVWQNVLLSAAMLLAARQAGAFSLLGPSPATGGANPAVAWQNPGFNIGYNHFGTDIGGPMNLGEEYRWNVPVITYAFDESFLNYFGTNGVAAVEAAIKVFNDLPATSQFSSNLTEFPLNATRVNFLAQSLGLMDLKSVTMVAMMEELGFAEPERFAWTLRDRRLTTVGNTTFTNYFVIQRNFDPVTLEPTPYVNGVLYNYLVQEFDASQRGIVDHAEAIEVAVQNPETLANNSVAGRFLNVGQFHPGLTRDDVGGLRYSYRPGNVNVENLLPDVQAAITNPVTTLLTNQDLALFIERTVNTTNSPANIAALYPGINFTATNNLGSSTVFLTNIATIYADFPALTVPTLLTSFPTGIVGRAVFVTNLTPVAVNRFTYSFDNVVTNTNSFYTNNLFIHRFTEVSLSPGFTPGSGTLLTNVVTNAVGVSNFLNGLIYIRPTNLLDFNVVSTQIVQVVTNTNSVVRTFGNLYTFTNILNMVPVITDDLTLLSERSSGTTLTPAQLRAIYTNILITRTNQRITNVLVTNFVSVGSNTFIVVTNALTNVFDYNYGNVVTTRFTTNAVVRQQTVEILANPFVGPASNLFITNLLSSTNIATNQIAGEFYIVPITNFTGVPTNLVGASNLAGYHFIAPLFTNVSETTNFIFTNLSSTNPAAFTNTSAFSNVITIDLALFSEVAYTNAPGAVLGALAAAFPNRAVPLITSTNSFFTNEIIATVTNMLVPDPVNPAIFPPISVQVTNFTTNVVQRFVYTFGNVITNPTPPATNGVFAVQTTTLTRNPLLPATSTNFITNVTTTLTTSNFLNGVVYVVPTNLLGWSIVNTQLVSVTNITNVVSTALTTNNGVAFTNRQDLVRFITNYFLTANPIEFINPTNIGFNTPGIRQEIVRSHSNTVYAAWPVELQLIPPSLGGGTGTNEEFITFSTNVVLEVNPIVFTVGTTLQPGLRRGVDKVNFQRVNFDSIVGSAFPLVTNSYTDVIVTNSTNSAQFLRRINTTPDIIFAAEDLGLLAGLGGPVLFARTDTVGWDNNNVINGSAPLGGPGVIRAPIRLRYNKLGTVVLNRPPFFLDQSNPFFQYFTWGSFDGSTNVPVVFPVGNSIQAIENAISTNAPAGP
jgi:hypothetical protein